MAQDAAPRLASATSAADPARDAAIEKLNAFLARYPDSPLRPNALFQTGELLLRRADDEFADAQRAAAGGGEAQLRPNYAPAIARYEELARRYPNYEKIDAAAYTLGTLYFAAQRYEDAARMFEIVTQREQSRFRHEASFRLGDSYFELAARSRGEPRRRLFARAAQAYEAATTGAEKSGDIYFLSLYKLGWSYYNQANRANQEEYRKAVEVFGRLVSEYDRLSPEQQARLGLRSEAIEYMAVAFTQVGGADAANQYFANRTGGTSDPGFKLPLLRRVAASLRDQGDFRQAVEAYRAVIAEAPADSAALGAQREIVDIFQNRIIEPDSAQRARLELVERFAPGTPWANANSALNSEASSAREQALRQSAQYSLSLAQRRNDRQRYTEAAQLYNRYLAEFASSDSALAVSGLAGEALFGQGEYAAAGVLYTRAAFGSASRDSKLAIQAGQNAIVAFDSALVRNKTDRAAQDSLFAAVDRFVQAFPDNETAKKALIQKGRRASETQRWPEMAAAFRTYAEKYPNDSYTPTAQKLIGDALYRGGQYAEAQAQWESAQLSATQSGRRVLADSIRSLRTIAAAGFADSLSKAGDYKRAAEEVYVAFADKNPSSERAPDALRNAIETYMLADSVARSRNDAGASREARERAIEISKRLAEQYPKYPYRAQYQNLQARLLAELGRRDEAVEALRALIRDNPSWSGRDDAMVQLAVTLDSAGKNGEAAAAYEQFAAAYPRDPRAADAQFNAAVTYLDAGDSTAAGRAYATFASRFPRDSRALQARQNRVALLKASGDSLAADRELRALCARPTPELRTTCAARTAETAFRQGASLFPQYKALRLVIPSKAQLTRAGVERASARKRALLRTMSGHFTRAISTGSPEWLSAATYYIGLAQWEYGDFLKNVRLPSTLTEEERAAAAKGSADQAEQFYAQARTTWQSLLDKAAQESISNPWVDRGRAALDGNIPETPPASSRRLESPVIVVGGLD